ncbi:MAG TPA: AtpZ/AtpI family protein [Thermomicrobiales bacterium]|nr:AtpZ/AtpI family protein [Thermomicrobiales bacterium]
MRDRPTPIQRSRWQAVGQAAGIGFGIAAALIVPIVGGLVLDGWLDRAPLFTLIGVAVGLVAAGYQLVELTKAANRVPVDPVAVEAARQRRAEEAEGRRRFQAQLEARLQAEMDAGNRGPERAPRRDEE